VDNLLNSTNDEMLNSSIDGTLSINSTRKVTYNVTLSENFNVSNVIELMTFVKYSSGSNITNNVQRIIIIDPNPIISVTSKNETLIGRINATIFFDLSTPKGELVSVSMEQFQPDGVSKTIFDILDKENQTINFAVSNINDTILDGNHTLVIKATNTLGQSTIVSLIYTVDRTDPTGSLTQILPSTTVTTTGEVTYEFSTSDVGLESTGVGYVTLDWGDNVTINVTSLTSASHTYRRSGSFTITLTVFDKVGNSFTVTADIIVSLEIVKTTETTDTPFPIIGTFSFFVVLFGFTNKRKKKVLS
jgi:hypothetical protein